LCGLASSAPIVLIPGVSDKSSSPPLPPSKLVALGLAAINPAHAVVKREPDSFPETRDDPSEPKGFHPDHFSTDWKREEYQEENYSSEGWRRGESQEDTYSGQGWKREDVTRDNSHIGGKRSDADLDIVNRDSKPIESPS